MIAISLQTIILSAIITGFPLDVTSCRKANQSVPAESQNDTTKVHPMSPQEALRVKEAADRFIRRFRQTLDFGAAFDEEFVSDAIKRLRRAGFFQSMNMSPQLVEKLNDPALERAYKAFMNYYYLKAVYDLGVGESESTPPEVTAVIRTSKFSSLLSDEGSGDSIMITTQQQLDEFVNDLSNVAKLYRGHLSQNVFDSSTYKAGLKTINKQRSSLQIRDGYESLGVGKGTKVYETERDVFTFFFVEDNGELRVLTLGMGN